MIIDPNAPRDADSVGVATPKRIEPSTRIIKITGGNITLKKSSILKLSCTTLFFGKFSGFIKEQIKSILRIKRLKLIQVLSLNQRSALLTKFRCRFPEICDASSFFAP